MNAKVITIRPALATDLAAVAQVHIQSWRETYPKIMPQEKLDAMNLNSSLRNWQNSIDSDSLFYIAQVGGTLCGFVVGGVNRRCDDCETGLANACGAELAAMYVQKKYHGKGVGKALFDAFTLGIKELGHKDMVAWVAAQNPACGFYAHIGGEAIDRRMMVVMGKGVPLLAYRYQL
jgi:GNAT superfamily N-acetyltransferase